MEGVKIIIRNIVIALACLLGAVSVGIFLCAMVYSVWIGDWVEVMWLAGIVIAGAVSSAIGELIRHRRNTNG